MKSQEIAFWLTFDSLYCSKHVFHAIILSSLHKRILKEASTGFIWSFIHMHTTVNFQKCHCLLGYMVYLIEKNISSTHSKANAPPPASESEFLFIILLRVRKRLFKSKNLTLLWDSSAISLSSNLWLLGRTSRFHLRTRSSRYYTIDKIIPSKNNYCWREDEDCNITSIIGLVQKCDT